MSGMNKTLARLLYLFRYLWTTSPQQMSNRVARVFNVHPPSDPKPWSSGKHKRWTRLPYFLEMFRTAAEEAGHELHFCRCPYCPEAFERDPNFYIQRLQGTIANEGSVLDHDGCCARPLPRES